MTDTNYTLESLGGIEAEAAAELIPEKTYTQTSPSSGTAGITSGTEERALALLGSGVNGEQVAAALGVTPGRIAQLLSEKHFSAKVADLRYATLQSHNVRDGVYDSLEDRLLGKLEKALPLLIKPESILNAMKIVNGAKRRGQSAPQQVTNQQNIVNLVLPIVITEKFSIDLNNQVIKAGDQELLTMPSGNLLKQVEAAQEVRAQALEHKGDTSNVQEAGSKS